MACNVAVCGECKYPRCIYSQYVKGIKKYDVSKEAKEQHWVALQQWKDDGTFTCGSSPSVKPYVIKQQLQCYNHVESMFYESRKINDDIICSFCCSIEDVLPSDEVKAQQVNTGGKQPLPFCEECIKHKITAPTMRVKKYGEESTREDGKGGTI
eukprot:3717301-Ditylum_brightwellii.AAC.1